MGYNIFMLNIEYIKKNFNPLDINEGPLDDKYKENENIIERDNIACIIKHPNADEYLLSFWKKINWSGFLTGGIENGKTKEETTRAEILEETGFKNIKNITDMNFVSHGLFYHVGKKQNRLAHYNLMFVELSDLEQQEISKEEKEICDFVWIKQDEVINNLKRNDMKYLWEYFILNKSKYSSQNL